MTSVICNSWANFLLNEYSWPSCVLCPHFVFMLFEFMLQHLSQSIFWHIYWFTLSILFTSVANCEALFPMKLGKTLCFGYVNFNIYTADVVFLEETKVTTITAVVIITFQEPYRNDQTWQSTSRWSHVMISYNANNIKILENTTFQMHTFTQYWFVFCVQDLLCQYNSCLYLVPNCT